MTVSMLGSTNTEYVVFNNIYCLRTFFPSSPTYSPNNPVSRSTLRMTCLLCMLPFLAPMLQNRDAHTPPQPSRPHTSTVPAPHTDHPPVNIPPTMTTGASFTDVTNECFSLRFEPECFPLTHTVGDHQPLLFGPGGDDGGDGACGRCSRCSGKRWEGLGGRLRHWDGECGRPVYKRVESHHGIVRRGRARRRRRREWLCSH
jgi:hypothetical protein